MTPKIVAEIERLRRELQQHETSPSTADAEKVIAAQDHHPADLRPHQFTRKLGRGLRSIGRMTGCFR